MRTCHLDSLCVFSFPYGFLRAILVLALGIALPAAGWAGPVCPSSVGAAATSSPWDAYLATVEQAIRAAVQPIGSTARVQALASLERPEPNFQALVRQYGSGGGTFSEDHAPLQPLILEEQGIDTLARIGDVAEAAVLGLHGALAPSARAETRGALGLVIAKMFYRIADGPLGVRWEALRQRANSEGIRVAQTVYLDWRIPEHLRRTAFEIVRASGRSAVPFPSSSSLQAAEARRGFVQENAQLAFSWAMEEALADLRAAAVALSPSTGAHAVSGAAYGLQRLAPPARGLDLELLERQAREARDGVAAAMHNQNLSSEGRAAIAIAYLEGALEPGAATLSPSRRIWAAHARALAQSLLWSLGSRSGGPTQATLDRAAAFLRSTMNVVPAAP